MMHRDATAGDEKPTTTVYRMEATSKGIWLALTLLCGYLIYLFVVLVQAGQAWGNPILIAVAIIPVMFVVRIASAGVFVTRDGVRVRNIRKTMFVSWEQIDRFSVGVVGVLKVGMLERSDGQRIRIWSVSGTNPLARPNNRAPEQVIERLNDELNQHRGVGDGSSPVRDPG